MYCSSCGRPVSQGLSYCNSCGAKLSGTNSVHLSKPAEIKPEKLVDAMSAVFVMGLIAIIGLMTVMKTVLGFSMKYILAFTLLTFFTMLVIEGVFIRLLLRGRRAAHDTGDVVQLKGQATRELDAGQVPALPEPLPSVTEHTTRAFEPVLSEPTKK